MEPKIRDRLALMPQEQEKQAKENVSHCHKALRCITMINDGNACTML